MRALWLLLAALTPVAVLIAFQGMITVGLLPLALFGPFYVIARAADPLPGSARLEGARMVAVSALGGGLAVAPVLLLQAIGQGQAALSDSLGLFLIGGGLGGLVGLATAPPARSLTPEEERRWTIVQAIDQTHGQELTLLFAAALPVAMLLALLRETPAFSEAGAVATLPEALLGDLVSQGYLLVPDPSLGLALALPLSLAPLALGFLIPARDATAFLSGGLVAWLLAPLAVFLSLPVTLADGTTLPLDLHPVPSLGAMVALAPAGAGALLGAGVTWGLKQRRPGRPAWSVAWGLGAAVVAALAYGWAASLALILGLAAAAGLLAWRAGRAPTGLAITTGCLVGGALAWLVPTSTTLLMGGLVGTVATGAVLSSQATRALPMPEGAIRSTRTLIYILIALILGGTLAYVAARVIATGQVPFRAPHARALAVGLETIVTGDHLALLLWGLAAGGLVQYLTGRGALAGLGFLAGPGVGLLVMTGSLLRGLWEGHLFKRARKGWVMRGEMGYELLRVHVLVAAILAGEALTLALAGWFGF